MPKLIITNIGLHPGTARLAGRNLACYKTSITRSSGVINAFKDIGV